MQHYGGVERGSTPSSLTRVQKRECMTVCSEVYKLVLVRRVIRAWWSSRSSKSSPRRFASRG